MKNSRNRISDLRRRKRIRRNLFRLLLRGAVWCGVTIVYYVLFSIFFDTPAEYKARHSTDVLREEYEALSARYDTLAMVMENITARDKSIFRVLFESDPYDFDSEIEQQRLIRYEDLLGYSTSELLAELNNRTSEFNESVDNMVTSHENLVSKMEHSPEVIRAIPAIQPIANTQLTLLTASYGMRTNPFYKKLASHQGVDFTIPEGTDIFASADGVVKSTSLTNSTQGKTLVIDHGNGYETSYSHLNRIKVTRGRRVKRGEVIAESGNTGLSLVPHLHYEVKYNGVRVDPIHYFFGELTPEEYQRMIRIAKSGMQSFD